jgi:4-diphosphocytidyl-2C-methyl-D-erythritol kinase
MSETAERAYAKLNLSLDVLGVLENGFHELLMVMQSVDLCDDVHIALTDGGALRVRTNLSYLPRVDRNLAANAARTCWMPLLAGGRARSASINAYGGVGLRRRLPPTPPPFSGP